jgi:hypothetical protein
MTDQQRAAAERRLRELRYERTRLYHGYDCKDQARADQIVAEMIELSIEGARR